MKPNVGMQYPVAALVDTYTPGTSITYETPFVVSEARGATLTWETSDGEFYGDDVLLDSDVGITGYTLDFESAGLKSDARAKLLGETVLDNSAGYQVTGKGSPDVGFGYVKVMRADVEGVVTTTYEGWFFYKMKYKLNSEEARTKEKNIEWRVPTLNGKGAGIYLDDEDDPVFAEHQDFDSLSEAKSWIMTKFGVTESAPASGGSSTPAAGTGTP